MKWWLDNDLIPLGDGLIDLRGEQLWRGSPQPLSATAVSLLRRLADSAGEVVRKPALLEAIGYAPTIRTRAVDMLVRRLRVLIEPDPAAPQHLITVPRVGLRLVPAAVGGAADFVGRGDALRALLQALRGAVVSVIGPGGIGKTRLIQQARPLLARRWEVVTADLTDAQGREDVLHAVGAALSVLGGGGKVPLELRIAQQLAARRPLVVLDNAETVSWELSLLLPQWRHTGAQVLTTTREPIGLSEERLIPLTGLSDADARTLIGHRAEHAPSASQVERILGAAEGNPLALELAARSGDGAIADSGFAAVLERSWQLLGSELRAVLAHATVFSGGIPSEAVDDVLQPVAANPTNSLEQLVRVSLVQKEGDRYRYHPRIHQLAEQRRDPALYEAVCARHAAWFGREGLLHVAGLRTTETAAHRRWLSQERNNLRAAAAGAAPEHALSALAALGTMPDAVGGPDAWLALLQQRDLTPAPDDLRAQLLWQAANVCMSRWAWDQARAHLREAHTCTKMRPETAVFLHCAEVGLWINLRGHQEAITAATTAVALAAKHRERAAWWYACYRHGEALHRARRHEEADAILSGLLAQIPANTPLHGRLLRLMADIATRLRRWEDAEAHLHRSLAVERNISGSYGTAITLSDLGRLCFMLERFEEAQAHMTAARPILERLGLLMRQQDAIIVLALCCLEEKRDPTALIAEIETLLRPGARIVRGMYLMLQAWQADAAGRADDARQGFTDARAVFAQTVHPSLQLMPLGELATLRLLAGDAAGALVDFGSAWALSDPAAAPRISATMAIRAAWCAHAAGADPGPWLQRTADILEAVPSQQCVAAWARVAAAIGRPVSPAGPTRGDGCLMRVLDRIGVPVRGNRS